jgi:hypothetical protein
MEEIDQNKCTESTFPPPPISRVSNPIRASSMDVSVKSPTETTVGQRKGTVVKVTKSIFAAKQFRQTVAERISDTPSTNSTETSSKPKREPKFLAILSRSDNQTPSPIPKTPRRPQSPASDFSDDLYGTGRPLRPGLINSTEKVHAWRLSSIGNPPLSISPPPRWEVPTPSPPCNTLRRNKCPTRHELSLLIPMDLEGLAVGSGSTVIEEDHSILTELNDVFLKGGHGGDEREYLEDDETDVDCETGKMVFQFEEVEMVKEGEWHGDDRLLEMNESQEDCKSHGHSEILKREAVQGDCDPSNELAGEITTGEIRKQCREAEDNHSATFPDQISVESPTTKETIPDDTIVNHYQLLPVPTQVHMPPHTQSPVNSEPDPKTESDKIGPKSPGTNQDAGSRPLPSTDPFASVLSSVRCRNDKTFGTPDDRSVDEMTKQDLKLFILKSGLFSG